MFWKIFNFKYTKVRMKSKGFWFFITVSWGQFIPRQEYKKIIPGEISSPGNSYRCGKVRRPQKSGCFPGSKGARGRRPHGSTITKLCLKRLHFYALECVPRSLECVPMGLQGPKVYLKRPWLTILMPHCQEYHPLLLILNKSYHVSTPKRSKNWAIMHYPPLLGLVSEKW